MIFGEDPITFLMDDNVTLANDFGTPGGANLTKDGIGTLTLTADTTFTGGHIDRVRERFSQHVFPTVGKWFGTNQ